MGPWKLVGFIPEDNPIVNSIIRQYERALLVFRYLEKKYKWIEVATGCSS